MKRKSMLLATAVAAVLAAATLGFGSTAEAQGWGMMGGYGPGYYGHMGYGGGYGPGYGPMMQGYGPGWMHGYGRGYRQGPRGPGYGGDYGPGYGPGWCFGQGGWR